MPWFEIENMKDMAKSDCKVHCRGHGHLSSTATNFQTMKGVQAMTAVPLGSPEFTPEYLKEVLQLIVEKVPDVPNRAQFRADFLLRGRDDWGHNTKLNGH